MRIAIFPTKRIGREVLKFLMKEHEEHIKLIVFESNGTDLYKEYKNIKPFLFYEDVYQNLDYIKSLDLDWIFLAWWPHIIKSNLIDIPRYGVINTHNSLLPYNRGVHSNFWAIVEQKHYGVSIHMVTPGVDEGDIISQKFIEYNWTDNGDTLYEKGMQELTKLFKATYPKIVENKFELTPQDHSKMTCHKKNEIENICHINLKENYKAEDLINIIRAKDCLDNPGAYFIHNNKKYEIRVSINEIDL